MKKWIGVVAMLCLSLGTVCLAAENVEAPAECMHCGMNRTAFAHSRMVVTYADGSSAGTCSLSCAVVEMNDTKGKKVASLRVADYTTKKLIDAKTATWVMGGDVQGVMTRAAKWAFARNSDARAFVKAHGGNIVAFDEALKAAQTENEQPAPHHMH